MGSGVCGGVSDPSRDESVAPRSQPPCKAIPSHWVVEGGLACIVWQLYGLSH